MNKLKNFFNEKSIKKISYRNDINGIRAIAVLSVVFYHSEISLFKGGYLGVDIFFVISGYLISNIIISQLNEDNFSFKIFYLRRIKRILPSLISTLILSSFLSYFLLPPNSLKAFAFSQISSVFFYANFYFKNLDFYISESSKYMPLLHIWSLSVEEQFYIFFPVFIYFLLKKLNNKYIYWISFIFIISIFSNTLVISNSKFYQLQYRIWEFLLGVLIMIFASKLNINNLEKIGILFLIFPLYYFGDEYILDIEPKLICLTGVSLILFSNKPDTKIYKFLSNKLFMNIGVLSYSIYMFHQPIFAFSRKFIYYFDIEYNIFVNILLIFMTLYFSYLNYHLIEKKFLYHKNNKQLFIFLLVGVFLILFYSFFIIYTDGMSTRYLTYPDYVSGAEGFDYAPQGKLVGEYENPLFILVGDSHAMHLLKYMSEVALLEKFSFIYISQSGCFSSKNYTNFYSSESLKNPLLRQECYDLHKYLINYAELYDIPVIFSVSWEKKYSKQYNNVPQITFNQDFSNWSENIDILIKEILILKNISENTKTWFIVGKNPGSYNFLYNGGYLECITKNEFRKIDSTKIICERTGKESNGTFYYGNELFKSKLNNINEINFIDTYDIYCIKDICNNFIEKNLVYLDYDHFTYSGSKPLVDILIKEVKLTYK